MGGWGSSSFITCPRPVPGMVFTQVFSLDSQSNSVRWVLYESISLELKKSYLALVLK